MRSNSAHVLAGPFRSHALLAACAVLVGSTPALANGSAANGSVVDDDHEAPQMSPEARLVELSRDETAQLFGDVRNPIRYRDRSFSQWYQDETGTYRKQRVTTQNPLMFGRPLYKVGPAQPGIPYPFGESNLMFPHLYLYGDWRTAAGVVDNGGPGDRDEISRIATRLNLDIDVGLTATERIHAFVQPFDKDGNFTRFDFGGDNEGDEELQLDGNLETLFFEGDLGAMFGGPGAKSVPVALGKFPLLFQNGIWVEDAFTGLAFSLPAKNSPKFDISNYDWTFFAAFDDVTTGAAIGPDENDIAILGATTFIEGGGAYWELGYGLTLGSGDQSDIDYHNLTAAYSRRYGAWLSNSVRLILNVGQDISNGPETADGALLLVENSLITSKPYTFVPYLNFFAGLGTPQSLARAGGAGGVLKNTGINFEADAITGFPSLTAFGNDAIGAAAGVEYLFALDKQVVFEIAAQSELKDDGDAAQLGRTPLGTEIGIGARAQMPLNNAWIVRADAMYGIRDDGDDISGVRLELRWKF